MDGGDTLHAVAMPLAASSFWADVSSGFIGGLAASLVALYVAYRFVDSRLHLKQRRESEAREQDAKDAMRTSVLSAILEELTSTAGKVQMMLKELPTGGIPYPGFDTTGWPLVSQASVFTTLEAKTVARLTHVYNRMASANEQLAFLADLNHGTTAILVNTVLAEALDKETPLARKAYGLFVDHRDATREMLIDRVRDLKGFVDLAIDAVEAELNLEPEQLASERVFVLE